MGPPIERNLMLQHVRDCNAITRLPEQYCSAATAISVDQPTWARSLLFASIEAKNRIAKPGRYKRYQIVGTRHFDDTDAI
jgi:hypothetical protein